MARKKRHQPRDRADLRGGTFIGLPSTVADSPAYVDLEPYDRAVLLEIMRAFNGGNNGKIGISYATIGKRLGSRNNRRISQAMGRLITHGMIAEPTDHSWTERRAREYRLTFISTTDGRGMSTPATNDYRHWTPDREKISGDAPTLETPSSGDAQTPEPVWTGDAGTPTTFHSPSKEPKGGDGQSGDGETLHILKPYGGEQLGDENTPLKSGGRICDDCGQAFKPGPHRHQRYCDERCRSRAEKRRFRERQQATG
ncbi:hypothetical protein [Sphingomicrobium clamense]|uniref:Helix-turn-helix domain-containing protein n=1 Tax=Sphingomicrobium clamense TaxID=2851013 RepID=A0ABS6V8Q0_9SPHN|nr:hypothetical protein [Sphingomicrobium sp. B8]MBW0145537.1 hypothetical protein [Sphingomicrobium sp. B8]